jgi:hypothetical protein
MILDDEETEVAGDPARVFENDVAWIKVCGIGELSQPELALVMCGKSVRRRPSRKARSTSDKKSARR